MLYYGAECMVPMSTVRNGSVIGRQLCTSARHIHVLVMGEQVSRETAAGRVELYSSDYIEAGRCVLLLPSFDTSRAACRDINQYSPRALNEMKSVCCACEQQKAAQSAAWWKGG